MSYGKRTFGLIVNPKSGELYVAERDKTATVDIWTLEDAYAGGGYFNVSDDPDYMRSQDITGYPRVHTGTGAIKEGIGSGTALYTALCQGAHLDYTDEVKFATQVEGDGISSMPGHRSEKAERWWKNARQKYGLAERVSGSTEEDFEEEDDLSGREAREAARCINDEYGDAEISYASVNYSVRGTRSVDASADVYPYANALEKNLIAGFYALDESVLFAETIPAEWRDVNLATILAANVSMYNIKKPGPLFVLREIASRAGAKSLQLNALFTRFRESLDVIAVDESTLDRLEQVARPSSGISGGRGHGKSAGFVPTVPLGRVRYGRSDWRLLALKGKRVAPGWSLSNQDGRSLQALAELRLSLGWGSFED